MSDEQYTLATTAPTQFVEIGTQRYAFRRFGSGDAVPLLCLQHFTGTLDNWDPIVTSALARHREVILFDNAGIGRSSGEVPKTVSAMGDHVLVFLDSLELKAVDILGYSLGGMVAMDMVKKRPSLARKLVLVGTAPRGGEDIMHLDKPSLAVHFADPTLKGYDILKKIFFTSSEKSQGAATAFVQRLLLRQFDREPISGPHVATAQVAAFREWETFTGERFADLRSIKQPTLVVNGVKDDMISVKNSYYLVENLPNAMLLVFPDAGHGSLFQYPSYFSKHVQEFLRNGDTTGIF
ncbi:alpha/beta hydrolase [Mesorhizobium sp. B2-1-8]|uniref:alpha/beta fold hydrolase n=1 Tax=Mesorhizobium sp. B2-1-8 TaxID=2589967 RepID=UPI00112BD41F|nr:alpha/beta hydrolase [Mesorhizobium sp. B2-1-8]UCI17893.1 alpha/beta hydrolase [Mesorhizobium sp. B2-1-8]